MNYGIIFWGNSSYGTKVFKLQKRVASTITGSINTDIRQRHYLFKNLDILITNHDQYMFNSETQGRNTKTN